MSQRHYLLFIDNEPVNEELKDYFEKFNLDIIQQKKLFPIHVEKGLPTAILINWSILRTEPEAIEQFYNMYPVPLIVINNKPDEESSVAMLEAGADDFMTKPIYPRELHARIGAISRRVIRAQQKVDHGKEVLMFANWRLYPASRQVFGENNEELQLSAGEYDLLLTFVQQPQRVLDREFLLQITKNTDLVPFDRRIDVQISRLRQKIEIDKKKPALIKTIRNGGYMFTARVVTLKESDATL
ncbi:TPA: winged helix-turn-helix domain-containing protein [Legionella pneumophila]|uniref:DNA-binding response regulator n=1 Tax=Legionella pneumophila TaxID=446 RepID=A0A378KBE0_LEGPN|nr:winged helix-turn-helix domain-containing protein [Legionella pneumophila]MCW8435678.1 winged helix-turn-helix domain-containing protein [Legionella pneumophila]MCW8468626.1 winged helix-turn-helix domain-containing protein [Legionella pneumophila]MCW8478297.1 winged helix-turn-helix domain-containing protein [Legionella pneumophila]MCZ4681410.1 winged helix-turn-helix domain-containing protein [Legionella pneumophila]MCZ4688861.1 winged helix-turn-helix domain-containing protein [Legionell